MSEVAVTSQQDLASKYKSYPEYKDSGVEWLGDVPTDWRVIKLGFLATKIGSGKTPSGGATVYVDDGITFLRSQNVYDDGLRLDDVVHITPDVDMEMAHSRVKPMDILINITGASIGRTCIVPLGIGSANVNQHVCIIRLNKSEIIRFVSWAVKAQSTKAQIDNAQTGAAREGLNFEQIASLLLSLPPETECEQISNFLDYETARIDRLIAQQQRLIELLKEKRQAVISHAVTKGLNPNAPMKESGVEWLGQVPEHWVISPLKYKCVFSGGGTPSKDNLEYWNGSIPWVSPKDMKSFWITDAEDKITEQAIKESSTKLVQPGAVLMVVRSGILQRTIPVGMNTIPVTMNQDMKAIRFSSAVYAEWLSFFIKGYEDSLLLDWRKQGATVESIEHEYLANSLMLFPPEEEARSIIAALGRRLDKFDQLEQRASDAITLLQERRTALISAAVTGKIDLRGWTQPAEEVAA